METISGLPKAKEQDMEVEFILIGAGLPRTGTHSTFTALEQLLPGKCHHMQRTMSGENDAVFWAKAGAGQVVEEDWKEFIKAEGLSAAVDYPMSLYWKDLMKIYPNAKVLLTVRDPVRWYLSVKNTIRHICAFLQSTGAAPIRMIGRLMGKPVGPALFTCFAPTYLGAKYPTGLFGAVDAGEETAVRFFNDWNEQVIQEVPADRLLVFEVKQGWDPLCKFLGVPKPEGPFPNTNDTKEQEGRLRKIKTFCFFLWSLSAAAVGTAAYFLKDSVPVPEITFRSS
eukprot:TRINITY_DN10830_c0_g1_i2.p1 TRINITY_DN10830_c0_g1~~TRINITY_DN10830_c0_g1_i2.p1  ORF type:complete len:282 (+),score=72.09 TRINITY_DN10830_c0_g1_i2:151-996(+)